MNSKLIKQVQAGTHCAKFNPKVNSVSRLIELMNICLEINYPPYSHAMYYWINKGKWYNSDTLPANLTPIPLDYFFKVCDHKNMVVEEVKHHYCPNCDSFFPNSPAPEQPLNLKTKNMERLTDVLDCHLTGEPELTDGQYHKVKCAMQEWATRPTPEQPALPKTYTREQLIRGINAGLQVGGSPHYDYDKREVKLNKILKSINNGK